MITSPGRIAFTILGIDVMWYGIFIAAAMAAAVGLAYARASKLSLDSERILDLALCIVPAGAIGARLYYVLFQWSYYAKHPLEALNFRQGGLAIHGGLLAGIGVGIVLARRWKLDIPKHLDLAAPSIALGQAIGRWGNFFNSEAHGRPTDVPWAVIVDGIAVHPTFLYESIWCLLLCLILIQFERNGNKKFDGHLFLLYAGLYSIERFIVEGLRTDSLMIGPLRAAQVFSVAVIAVCFIVYRYRKKQR